ncbi:MAG: 23S rRNA (uracil(1939)-C(5))-methyltransferase RlmD [Longicatena sp.]
MKKNDRINASCIGYTHDGHGVVKTDGYPIFVKGMMKDESGEINITLAKKNFAFGKLIKLTTPSPQRITPLCPIAKECGGCQLQHMSYPEQLSYKKQKVVDVMERIAKIDVHIEDVLGMEDQAHYRNKGQIPVGLKDTHVVTGFYRINSNSIIDSDHCMIQSKRINEVLKLMRSLLERYGNANFFRHLLIKDGFHSGEVMVVWIVKRKEFPHMKAMQEELVNTLSFIKSVIVNVNTRDGNVILGEKEYLLYGEDKITDSIHDLKFQISSKSFYQVNPKQTEVLYGKALEFADLKGNETVLDLYCGVGTISMFLAQKAKKVIGIEIVPQAIEDAKNNAKLNNISNIEFICSDAATIAKELSETKLRPDIIVVDPPRKGCDESTLQSMVAMNPNKIIYVSCDPATLARDLKMLYEHNYKADKIQPVDMFPYSFHVENVALMSKIK